MGGEFTVLDWAVVAAYFVGITAFGIWIARKTRTSGGYFLGDRKLPWWVMMGQSFGTGTHAENPVAQAGATFRFGFATIWYQWKNMLITPFYWLMAPWYRRSQRTTIGEMMEDRYGRGMALFYTLFAMAYFVLNQGTMMKGAGKVISVATGGDVLSANEVVVAMVGAFVAYSLFGGLVASAYTDFVQGFLIIAMSFMLIPAGLWTLGGFQGMRDQLTGDRVAEYALRVEGQNAEGLRRETARLEELVRGERDAGADAEATRRQIDEQRARLEETKRNPPIIPGDNQGTAQFFDVYNRSSKIDAFTLLMLTLNGFIGITAQPHTLSMNATGSTERAGRVGQTYGSFVKRFCTIGWAFTGLIVAAIIVQQGDCLRDQEAAFGYACLHLLCPGLTGLMVACILAANMSTCSNFMVNSGALFTRNFYSIYVRPQARDRELLLVGRLSGLTLTLLGVLFAFSVGQILDTFLFLETLPAFLGIALMGGILWKRANRRGAFAAVVASLAVYYALNFLLTCTWRGQRANSLTEALGFLAEAWRQHELWDFLGAGSRQLIYPWLPAPYGWATLAGVTVFVVVSLLTRPEEKERVERFFDNMRRSTDREGSPEGHPRPLAAELGQDLILLDLPGWLKRDRWRGFFRRYREDLVGFALAWGAVGLLVLSAWGLMQIGK